MMISGESWTGTSSGPNARDLVRSSHAVPLAKVHGFVIHARSYAMVRLAVSDDSLIDRNTNRLSKRSIEGFNFVDPPELFASIDEGLVGDVENAANGTIDLRDGEASIDEGLVGDVEYVIKTSANLIC